jgi:hypothetical protein
MLIVDVKQFVTLFVWIAQLCMANHPYRGCSQIS